MLEISRTALFGKLNPLAYKAIEGATVFCKLRGNPYVELQHWLYQILNTQDSDLHASSSTTGSTPAAAGVRPDGVARPPAARREFGDRPCRAGSRTRSRRAWVYGSLMFGDTQVRTGYSVVGLLKTPSLRSALMSISKQFDRIKLEDLTDNFARILGGSPSRACARATAAARQASPGEASGAIAPAAMGKQEALKRYAVDLTERARQGEIDPVAGATRRSARSSTSSCAGGRTIPSSPARPASARRRWWRASRCGWPAATCRRS
jgi:type VI secretion system protein VasG